MEAKGRRKSIGRRGLEQAKTSQGGMFTIEDLDERNCSDPIAQDNRTGESSRIQNASSATPALLSENSLVHNEHVKVAVAVEEKWGQTSLRGQS